jgi:hypothetical protein
MLKAIILLLSLLIYNIEATSSPSSSSDPTTDDAEEVYIAIGISVTFIFILSMILVFAYFLKKRSINEDVPETKYNLVI